MSQNLHYKATNIHELELEVRETISRIMLLQDDIDALRISLISEEE